MKVSVLIPTFNRAHTLKRCIDSVLNQSFQEFEIIVVDDGSSDGTENLLLTYGDRISFYKTENKGVSAARNFGFKKSNGEWIALLDSDDEWLKDKLKKQLDFIASNPEIKIVHGEEIWIRNGKRVNPKKIHKKMGGNIFQMCLPLCCISPSASIIKRDLYEQFSGFREDFPVCEDYDLWLKITSRYEVGFIETPIINKYGGHEDQLSQKYFAMDLWRVRSIYGILKTNLSSADRKRAREVLEKKSRILINGFKKHDNLKHLLEVESYLDSLKSS